MNSAFTDAASDEVLAILTGDGPDDGADQRRDLFAMLSRRAGGRVLEQLAIEEDAGRRRMLIDLVTEIARIDIRSVLPGLSDPRWFVVRNVVIALGRSARKGAGNSLVRVVDHEDHRVRIEALRALIPCLGIGALDYLVAALADDHIRVRAAASDLLGTLDEELVVPALSSALRNETLALEVRMAVIDALSSHRTESAQSALRSIAESKTRFSPSARTLRSAARDALRSTNG
jgi:HEAT repeat protein